MIAELLPTSVSVIESEGDTIASDPCLEEVESLGRVAARRLHEFLLARECARQALAELGLGPRPVRVGPDRAPMWPDGIVGSITHCVGYRAAAVGRRARVAGIGIDAEVNEPLPPSIISAVILADEHLEALALPRTGVAWDRLCFCAKESVYKVWYPIMRSWLDFSDARIAIQPDPSVAGRGTFSAHLLSAPLLLDNRRVTRLQGRFVATAQRIVTAISIDAESSADSAG